MITKDTRLIDLTVGELKSIIDESLNASQNKIPKGSTLKRKIGLAELCHTFGFSKSTVYNWTSDRFIPHSKVGKRLIFDVNEVNLWIVSLKIKTKNEQFNQ